MARHGPYLELYADGTTARQGLYYKGIQAGQWIRWSPRGIVERELIIWPGEASRHIPSPEDLCPVGTRRVRSTGHDHRRRMWSKCQRKDAAGAYQLHGPRVTWDEEKAEDGGVRYVLRRIMGYRDGERHGRHREFAGPFGREVVVEDETFDDGSLQGESRGFFLDGTLRELRNYENGLFEGERIAYFADGSERWRATYERGTIVHGEGEMTVGGEPCPSSTVPTASADGLEVFCARRTYHFVQRHGPYVHRDSTGQVVESGVFEWGEKKEVWQGAAAAEEVLQVGDEVLVAEGQLMIGEEAYGALNSPPPLEEPMDLLVPLLDEPELLERELQRLNGRGEGARPEESMAEAPASTSAAAVEVEEVDGEETLTFSDVVDVKAALDAADVFKIWFRDTVSKKYPSARTVVEDGLVRIYGLTPGNYYMRVEIDANTASPMQYPGDLTSSSTFEVRAGEISRFEAPLFYTLHLVEPFDNDRDIPGWGSPCGEAEELGQRLRFRWRSPEGDDATDIEYEYRVRHMGCDPFRPLGVVAEGKTYDTAVDLELSPSRRGETYEWTLLARRGDKVIGQLMTFGGGGHGWSLRFRVR